MRVAFFVTLIACFLSLVVFASAQQAVQTEAEGAQWSTAAESGSFELALRFYREGHFTKAVEEFNKVVKAEPNNAAAFYLMGYAHYVLGHHSEALAAFRKAFEVDPNFDPRPYFQ